MAGSKKVELSGHIAFDVGGASCVFRGLKAEDVSAAYVDGLRQQRSFLENNPPDVTIETQRTYVSETLASETRTICGLFVDGILTGTAGLQNLIKADPATIGIFVFSSAMRGKGYGKTLVWGGCVLARERLGVDWFKAGMKKVNATSLRAFSSCGFGIVGETEGEYQVEVRGAGLIKPDIIRSPVIDVSRKRAK